MAAKAQFGQVIEFDPQVDDWTHYVERLDYYFVANDITKAKKKHAVLLSVVGTMTYRLLRNLIAPAKPDEKTYKELVDAVKVHYCPKPSETVQRYKFHSRVQQPTKSVSTYIAELHSLIEFCGFPVGEASDKMLRDRLVCGINNPGIQRRLLSEDNLDFKKA